MEKNFFWPDMKADIKSFENEKNKNHFEVKVNYRKLKVYTT